MKKTTAKWLMALMALTLSTTLVSCEKDPVLDPDDQAAKDILDNYVNTTVVPTYKALAEASLEMRRTANILKTNKTDATVRDAANAWMTARIWWEKSEAFLFGPVGDQALDVDGHIDSWPLEVDAIDAVLATQAASMTGRSAWLMDAEVIGFHTTEYLLYRQGQSRTAASITAAEVTYLTAATDALVWDCVLAYVAWVGEENVSSTMRDVFNENPDVVAHLNNNPSYKNFAHRLTNAVGYSSWADALGEIAVGAAEIAGEVGATKIEAPYRDHKIEEVESWYSWHSLDDYKNNIQSIKNAYLGGVGDGSRTTVNLSGYVASKNAALDTQIKDKIDECTAKITAIGTGGLSFYEVVRDRLNASQVNAAVVTCLELQTLFDGLADVI